MVRLAMTDKKMSCNKEVTLTANIISSNIVEFGNNWRALISFPSGYTTNGIVPSIPLLMAQLISVDDKGGTGLIFGSVIVNLIYN